MNTNDLFRLDGKNAIVTGATGYLGREMVRGLSEAGAHVYINSRNRKECDSFAENICSRGLKASSASFDITNDESIIKFYGELGDSPLHILVNNAYSGAGGTIESSSSSDYSRSYETIVGAAHGMLHNGLSCLRKAVLQTGEASVINVASMYALVSPDISVYDSPAVANPPFYGAAKAALCQFSRYAACEFASDGIRVNTLVPGPFPQMDLGIEKTKLIKELEKKVPMRRIGKADEVRGGIVYLSSRASSFVTGSELVIDGGWTSW